MHINNKKKRKKIKATKKRQKKNQDWAPFILQSLILLPLIEYFAHFVNVKPDEGGSSLVQGFGLDPQKYFDNKTRTGIRLGKGGGGQCERNF